MTRSRCFGFAFTLASLVATMSLAGIASAADPAAGYVPPPPSGEAGPPPAGYVGAPPPVDSAASDPEQNYKHVTIQANPLSAIIGRYGVDVAYLPALHHGIVVNPFYAHTSFNESSTVNGTNYSSDWTLSGFGGEVGYRFYTGERGANGFYVGPSFLFSSYKQSGTGDGLSFTNVGGAIDIGGQAILGGGFTIGGGFGLQYTKTSVDLDDVSKFAVKALAGGGIRPRFLFTLGYSF